MELMLNFVLSALARHANIIMRSNVWIAMVTFEWTVGKSDFFYFNFFAYQLSTDCTPERIRKSNWTCVKYISFEKEKE